MRHKWRYPVIVISVIGIGAVQIYIYITFLNNIINNILKFKSLWVFFKFSNTKLIIIAWVRFALF